MRIGLARQRLLDLGTGTGILAREFARRGCLVTGVDISASLLDVARRANASEVVRPHYVHAQAEATGLPGSVFDIVSAGASWHLFNRPAAAREARRVLLPGGHLLIAHLDWHTSPGPVASATLRLLERSGAATGGPLTFLYPDWTQDLVTAGFCAWDMFGFTTTLPVTPATWRGRMRARHRAAPSMTKAVLDRFDASLARMLARRFPGPVLEVEHRVFALIAR